MVRSRRQAEVDYAELCTVAADLAVKVGRDDLAGAMVERAVGAARASDEFEVGFDGAAWTEASLEGAAQRLALEAAR